MTEHTMQRVARAMVYQNRGVKPHRYVPFENAYVVGRHIWFAAHCAKEWLQEVTTNAKLEIVSYKDAYEFAKQNKLTIL